MEGRSLVVERRRAQDAVRLSTLAAELVALNTVQTATDEEIAIGPAEALGLTIPASPLQRADQVIE